MPKYNLGRAPLLLPLIAFVGGLILSYSGCPFWLVACVAFAGAVVYRFLARMAGILLLVMAVGMLDGLAFECNQGRRVFTDGVVTCVSTVDYVREGHGSRSVIMIVDSLVGADGESVAINKMTVSAIIPSFLPEFVEGDIIRFSSILSEPVSHVDLPDEFDEAGYLKKQGVQAVTMLHPDSIRVVGAETSALWRLRQWNRYMSRLILGSSLSDEASSFIVAVLCGDRSAMPRYMKECLTGVGLAHILALSGLHVGIVTWVVIWVLWPLFVLRWRKMRSFAVICILWCYALATGLSPSVTRAVIMASVFLMSLVFERRSSPVNSLCLAAILILAFEPKALVSLSFQMSFIAVASILAVMWLIGPLRKRCGRVGFGILSFVSVSLAAGVSTGILSAYYFHVLPLYFILANAGVALFLPVIICGGMVLLICELCGFDPLWLCEILNLCVRAVCRTAELVGMIPGAVVSRIYFSAWLVVPYFMMLACAILWLKRKRPVWGVMVVMLCVMIGALHILLRQDYPVSELFVTRERFHTNVVVRHGNQAYMFTTAKRSYRDDVLDECTDRYAGYLDRRNVDGLSDVTDQVVASGNLLSFCWQSITIVNDESYLYGSKGNGGDYLLVCRGFKGDVVDLALHMDADTILLSNDINAIRHARYLRELTTAGIPCRSLRERAFYLSSDCGTASFSN